MGYLQDAQRTAAAVTVNHVIQKLQTIDVIDAQVVADIITPIQAASPKLVAFVKTDRPQSQINELEKKNGRSLTHLYDSLVVHMYFGNTSHGERQDRLEKAP